MSSQWIKSLGIFCMLLSTAALSETTPRLLSVIPNINLLSKSTLLVVSKEFNDLILANRPLLEYAAFTATSSDPKDNVLEVGYITYESKSDPVENFSAIRLNNGHDYALNFEDDHMVNYLLSPNLNPKITNVKSIGKVILPKRVKKTIIENTINLSKYPKANYITVMHGVIILENRSLPDTNLPIRHHVVYKTIKAIQKQLRNLHRDDLLPGEISWEPVLGNKIKNNNQ